MFVATVLRIPKPLIMICVYVADQIADQNSVGHSGTPNDTIGQLGTNYVWRKWWENDRERRY